MHLSSNSPTSRPTLLAEYGQEYETNLSPLEALILAQAVWELGADAWPSVAAVLSNHPLLTRPENFFTPQVSLLSRFRGLNAEYRSLFCIAVMSHYVHFPNETSES